MGYKEKLWYQQKTPTKPTKPKVIKCHCNNCRWKNALQMKQGKEFDYNGI
jgi:hypothetical protein